MDTLLQIGLFQDLDRHQAEKYARSCIWRNFTPNEIIMDEDDCNDMRFVISGRVRLTLRTALGKEIILDELERDGFFGEMSNPEMQCRHLSVTAVSRTRICTIPQQLFLEIICQNPQCNLQILNVLARRISQLSEKIAERSFLQAKHRLYAELVRMSKCRNGDPERHAISPPPIQQELAERIGARREVVSRELSKLQRMGILEKTRGALILLNVGELKRQVSLAFGN